MIATRQPTAQRGPHHLGVLWSMWLVTILTVGCQTIAPQDSPRAGVNSDQPVAAAPAPHTNIDLEREYLIGPAAARELDYRIDWQQRLTADQLKLLAVQGDSVFFLDGRNVLTRLGVADGEKYWGVPAAAPVDEVFGITAIAERVHLTTVSGLLVLDAANGGQIDKHKFEKIANTAPVVFGGSLIYGSRNGHLIWHAYEIGYPWRGYQVSTSMSIPPVLVNDRLIAVGSGGIVMVLSASSASQRWSRQLLDSVSAAPAASTEAVYVAGLDQHLRAFDLDSGRALWKYLTKSPLSDSPTLIADRVYQQVPGEGLSCFDALPLDSPGGRLLWQSRETTGRVIMNRRDLLTAWDADRRRLTLLEAARGGVVKQIDLAQVDRLITAGEAGQDLLAASHDGRVIRLVPRN